MRSALEVAFQQVGNLQAAVALRRHRRLDAAQRGARTRGMALERCGRHGRAQSIMRPMNGLGALAVAALTAWTFLAPPAGSWAFAAAEFAFLSWLAASCAASTPARCTRARASRSTPTKPTSSGAMRSTSRGRRSRANAPRRSRRLGLATPGAGALAHLQAAMAAGDPDRRAAVRGGTADQAGEPGLCAAAGDRQGRPRGAAPARPRTTARRASCQPQISQAPSANAGGRKSEKLTTALMRVRSWRVELRLLVLLRRALLDRLLHEHVLDQRSGTRRAPRPQSAPCMAICMAIDSSLMPDRRANTRFIALTRAR